jgi:hypothetical protein
VLQPPARPCSRAAGRQGRPGQRAPALQAPHREVLDQLLAQVVVDAVDLLLTQVRRQAAAQLGAGGGVAPKRLLHDHARPACGGGGGGAQSQGGGAGGGVRTALGMRARRWAAEAARGSPVGLEHLSAAPADAATNTFGGIDRKNMRLARGCAASTSAMRALRLSKPEAWS